MAWFLACLALYLAFCVFWAAKSARRSRTAADLLVSGRDLTAWVFVMGVTGASFAGWHFVGMPGLFLRDGFPVGYAGFAAIMVPLTGVLFFKRQWMLGKRFGYVTSGEMFADYFQDNLVRIGAWLISLLFAVSFLGMALGAAGFLVDVATGGLVPRDIALLLVATVLLIYVTAGGIRAIAYVGTLQTLLIFVGTIILGLLALDLTDGFRGLNRALAGVAASPSREWGTTAGFGGGDYNPMFAVSGVAQWTAGQGEENPVGGLWTGVLVMTFMVGFMGVLASPAFSLWAFSARTPRPFAPQQLWGAAVGVGILLLFFVVAQGAGALLLGASREVAEAGLGLSTVLPELGDGEHGRLVPTMVALLADDAPWLFGLLAVCAIAMAKTGGGILMLGAGATTARDVYKTFVNPGATEIQQKRCVRVTVLVTTGLAVLVALFAREGTVVTGEVAIPLAAQLLPALMAVLWFPWLTRKGVNAGLVVGALAVVFTDSLGIRLSDGFLPWGRWPWTIHAAAWGLAANLAVCVIGSAMSQSEAETAHREKFHEFLRAHGSLSGGKRRFVSFAWIVTLAWVFFGVGPGTVIGNYAFGEPGAGYDGWHLAMPSIWAWQIIWWGIGCLLIWFLAYKMELATPPRKEVHPLRADIWENRPPPG